MSYVPQPYNAALDTPVSYAEQTLTSPQKTQGRANLDAVATTEVVRKYTSQPATNQEFFFLREEFDWGDYTNTTLGLGFNINRYDTSKPSLYTTIETKYELNNEGPFVTEWHIQGERVDGEDFRCLTFAIPHDASDGNAQGALAVDYWSFQNGSGTERILYNWLTNSVFYGGSQSHRISQNNIAFWSQRNAADNDYLNLPWFNDSNQLRVQGPVFAQGAHSAANGQNSAFYLQATGTHPDHSSCMEVVGPAHTGWSLRGISTLGSSTNVYSIEVYNSASGSSNNAAVFEAIVNSTTGKALSRYWSAIADRGLDVGYDSNVDKFIIADVRTISASSQHYFDITRTGTPSTSVATCRGKLAVVGNVGFNNVTPIAKPTVTGSAGSNAALQSLLTALADYGLITNSSS